MSKPEDTKYSIDLDMDWEVTESFGGGRWLNASHLSTEGDTLEQLVDNAYVFTSDQDGGEGPELMLSDMSQRAIDFYTKRIAEAMARADDRAAAAMDEFAKTDWTK